MNIRTSAFRGLAILSLSVLGMAACDKKDTIIEFPPEDVVVTVSPASMTLEQGTTGTLIAVVTGDTNQNVTWASSNTAVATVSNAGVVTAVAPGTATITATSAVDATARGAALVTVTPRATGAVTITLAPTSASINPGGTVQLVGVVSGSSNTAITYRSSTPAVATVNASGLVTGVAPGTAIITALAAADTTKRVTATITVSALNTVVAITPTVASVGVGGTQQFVATVSGNPNTAVTFRTSNPAVATVTNAGIATGVAAGTAVITAVSVADTLARASATLTVVGASVAISTTSGTPAAGPFTVSANVSVPAGTADSLMIRLTNTTTGTVYNVRCQTFTAAGAATTVVCPVNPADLDPNTAGAQILPNGTYTLAAVLIRQNTQAAIATFGEPFVTNVANTVAGVVTWDNTLVDTDNTAAPASAVDGAGNTWNGGSATVTLTPSVFQGNAITAINVGLDLNCDGVDATRAITVGTTGTGSVTFSEANIVAHATAPGIDNVSNPTVCFIVDPASARDAGGAAVQLLPGSGTGNITVGVAGANNIPGPTQNQFRIDNVEPVIGATLPDFPASVAGQYVPGGFTFTSSGTNAITNLGGANLTETGVGGVTYTFYATTAAVTGASTQAQLAAAATTPVTTSAELQSTIANNAYTLIVKAVDRLGNTSYRIGDTFGVDLTNPTIAVAAGSAADASINPTAEITFNVTDDFSSPLGVRGTVIGYSTFETDGTVDQDVYCYDLAGALVATNPTGGAAGCAAAVQNTVAAVNGTTESFVVVIPADERYYEIVITSRDEAGNVSSTTVARTALVDAEAPTATATVYTIDIANNTASVSGTVQDNVEVDAYDNRFQYVGLAGVPDEIPFVGLTDAGSYGLPLTGQVAVTGQNSVSVDNIVTDTDGPANNTFVASAALAATSFGFGVWDLAANYGFGGVAIPAGAFSAFPATYRGTTLSQSAATIDRNASGGVPNSTTLSAVITTDEGATNPISTVYFYYVHPGLDRTYGTPDDYNVLVGSTSTAGITPVTGGGIRTFTVAGPTLTTSMFLASVLPGPVTGYNIPVFAVAVDAQGDGQLTEVDNIAIQD